MKTDIYTRDDTIAEIHRARSDIADKFDGDLFAINHDAQIRTENSGRKIIRLQNCDMANYVPPTSVRRCDSFLVKPKEGHNQESSITA